MSEQITALTRARLSHYVGSDVDVLIQYATELEAKLAGATATKNALQSSYYDAWDREDALGIELEAMRRELSTLRAQHDDRTRHLQEGATILLSLQEERDALRREVSTLRAILKEHAPE